MSKRKREAVEVYHDRVAGIYDTIYAGDPYWEAVFSLTWRHILRHLPKRSDKLRCLDVGCGTGRFGLGLFKAGYATDFLDISQKMLDQVANKLASMRKDFVFFSSLSSELPAEKVIPLGKPLLYHSSLSDISFVADNSYDFIVSQGDALNCVQDPELALQEIVRILKPNGILIFSVDNRLQGIYHYFKEGNVFSLADFLRTGKTSWVTDNVAEQYPIVMFTPGQIRSLCKGCGLELLSLIGKTVLPLRRFKDLLKDPDSFKELMRIEESLHAEECMLANAAHLEFVAKKSS